MVVFVVVVLAVAVVLVVLLLVIVSLCGFGFFLFLSVDIAAFLSAVTTANVGVVKTRPGNSCFLSVFFVSFCSVLFSVHLEHANNIVIDACDDIIDDIMTSTTPLIM